MTHVSSRSEQPSGVFRMTFRGMVMGAMAALTLSLPQGGLAAQKGKTSTRSSPVIPGLHQRHPLSRRQVGELLLNELRCVSCHETDRDFGLPPKAAPTLTDVGSRVAPEYLRRFIAAPAQAHPGTTMPQMLAHETAAKRKEIAAAITDFLLSRSRGQFTRDPVAKRDATLGRKLYHDIGCVACHSPRDKDRRETAQDGAVTLTHVSTKYNLRSLSAFLFQPLQTRPSGRMPDMLLTRDEARAIASYLIFAPPLGPQRDAGAPDNSKVALGQKHLQRFNCSACHLVSGKTGDLSGRQAKPLHDLNPARGCLSEHPGNAAGRDRPAVPRFGLSRDQVEAIREALKGPAAATTDRAVIDMTLTAFNCIACHTREDYGGVTAEHNRYFTTSEKDLGDHARIPPSLTGVGGKLQTLWLQKVLFDGERVRPYMHTRMPQFGEENLRSLPALFDRADPDRDNPFVKPGREKRRELRTAGHQLLGDKGLNCITCHNFNGKASPGFKGMDLVTSMHRLKPGWFDRFLRSPGRMRPGMVMPEYWPGGKAARTDILGGDTNKQIHAIWHTLSLGRSARDPSGMRHVPSKLVVTDTVRTYRGRSGIAGFRGIAVGFPGGLNFAFNAYTGSLAGLWRGGFVNVGWSGQGAGQFHPAGRAVSLPQDVSFFRLADSKAPWPVPPKKTKDNPVDPAPLYPRRLGYRFRGYFFDERSIPTFMYRMGKLDIEDRSTADLSGGRSALRRTLRLTSAQPQTIWFRALTGRIKQVADRSFATEKIRLEVEGKGADVSTVLRSFGDDGRGRELLLALTIPQGNSTVSIRYELLR